MPENKIIPFNYGDSLIRVVNDDATGEQLWVAKDVCEVLGYKNHLDAISKLDDDERGGSEIATPSGIQTMSCISESGLYTLIIRSNKPEAKPFKRWITHEVLPSIRKTGGYNMNGASATQNADLTPVIEMFKQHNELMQQQTQVMLQLQEQVTLLNAPIVKPLTLDAKMMDKLNLTLSDVALILARDRKITLSQAKMVLYSQLNTRFEVSNYYKIPHFRYLEAMQFLRITKEQLKLKQENLEKSLDENIERVLEEEYDEEREYEEDERPVRKSGMYN